MAKEKERKLAYIYYTEQGLTAKEIAQQVGTTEKTVGEWVAKGNWKDIRTANLTGPDQLIRGYKDLLEALLEKRLEIEKGEREADELRGITDEISKISKAMESLRDSNKPSLKVQLICIEKFMKALYQHNPKLFMELIDFQRQHALNLAEELK